MKPEGEYGSILDRLGAISDREVKTTAGYSKIDEFVVCALRGFGLHKTALGTGTYGAELEQCLRRQARIQRDRLWQEKIRFLITNRIAKGCSTGRFGMFDGEGGEDVCVALADCFPLDAAKYRAGTCGGAKMEEKKSDPHTMSCFVSSAKQEIKLFCLLYGEEHKRERKAALRQFKQLREEKPDLFTANMLVRTWNRMWAEYGESVREGIRALLRILPEGAGRGALITLALSPYKGSKRRIWRWPNVFSFTSSRGFWLGRVLPEVEEDLEQTRIRGTKPTLPGGEVASVPPVLNRRERRPNQRTGTGKSSVVTPIDNSEGKGRDVVLPPPVLDGYPVGKRLRSGEFEASKQFSPKEENSGKTYCWNFNANCGCSHKGSDCPFGLHQGMKHAGLHWTVRAQLARRGGLKGSKILAEKAADGFTQALREANLEKDNGKKKGQNPPATNGGYSLPENAQAELDYETLPPPPGLNIDLSLTHKSSSLRDDTSTTLVIQEASGQNLEPIDEWIVFDQEQDADVYTNETSETLRTPNQWVGSFPGDVGQFDFTLMEDDYRLAIFGRDDCLIPTSPPSDYPRGNRRSG